MIEIKRLKNWYKSAHGVTKYTAFIKVAGMRIPKEVRKQFRRAASGEISHDDLRTEFMDQMSIKRGE